jgi:hypothetical protein
MQSDEQPEFEQEQIPESAPEAVGSEFNEDDTEELQPSDSRLTGWLRRSLRWLAGLAFVFALGVLIVFFARVRPQSDRIRSLERQFDENQQALATAQTQIDDLGPLREENQRLLDDIAEDGRHLALLSVLVDVTNAQLDLAQDQPDGAKTALEDTGAKLESLLEGLEGQDADAVQSMLNRLDLVLQELESDTFAAQRDLEIMANNLVDFERNTFQR